jgi:hypothetical protein
MISATQQTGVSNEYQLAQGTTIIMIFLPEK